MVPRSSARGDILVALAEAPAAASSEVEGLSEASCDSVWNVVRLHQAMLGQRLIEELEDRPDPALDDERRRYYQLPAGRAGRCAELDRLTALTRTAAKRLPAPSWG